MPYVREQIRSDDNAMLNLDWLVHPNSPPDAPVLVVLPGITGHSRSGYLVNLVHEMYKLHWKVCVIVYPGTDMSDVQTARFIRAHVPTDLDLTLKYIRKQKYPQSPMYAVGYSMGAALLTNYIAHSGPSGCLLKGAVSCSNPFNVLYSVRRLSTGLISRLYNIHFLSAMKKMHRKNAHVFDAHFPHMPTHKVQALRTVEEYDSHITMKYHGFDNLDEYYTALGCETAVPKIHIPYLLAQAEDDPIVSRTALPMDNILKNHNIFTVFTKMGGHTGWLDGLLPLGPSWFDKSAVEWLVATHKTTVVNPLASTLALEEKEVMSSINKKSSSEHFSSSRTRLIQAIE